jgi:NADH-quinone oxidoreductase subunit L
MVTAGVYLVVRMSFLYEAAPGALVVIAWTGGATAIFAALLATAQNDIKKVLAYSTISQLGYMFMAVGSGAYTIAIFHLVTHAFFKALLFMAAGAVIVAAHHEQDMRGLGGLRKNLKGTWWVMLFGALALSGAPPLSGFFSKDEILTTVYFAQDLPGHGVLYQIGLATAGITAFYMFRMFFMTFHGKTRLPRSHRGDLQDPAEIMMWPLYILAALAFFGGVFGMPQFWGDRMQIDGSDSLGHFLASVVAVREVHEIDPNRVWQLVGLAVAVSVAGFGVAYVLCISRPQLAERIAPAFAWLRVALERKLWVDEVYDTLMVRPLLALSDRVLYRGIDVGLIDRRLVEGSANIVWAFAQRGLKHVQSGLAQAYLLMVVAGTVAVLAYLIG